MTSESLSPAGAPTRRTVVAAVGAAGVAVALTACSSNDDSSSSSSDTQAGSDASSGGSGDTGSAAAGGGTALAKTADIPQGGGKIFKDQGVVVTQPTAGTFKAFSSKCPHRGCAVGSVADGVIVCPCHNSQFSATDGSVKKGPATQGLAEEKITVSGDSITLA
ncbi:Rieske (2Fe-2S) protein [Streptomyces sp. YIM S03343]